MSDVVLDLLDLKITIPLTSPFIAKYLLVGKSQADIARLSGRTPQAVNDYIQRHSKELAPLIDTTDNLVTIKCKHIANKAMDRITKHLDETTKKDLIALNAISGTHIDKYQALSGKLPLEQGKLVFQVVYHDNRQQIVNLPLQADDSIDVTPKKGK